MRTDRTTMLDLAVEWTLSPGYALHIEINEVRNQSTTLLYENRYRQILAGLRASFEACTTRINPFQKRPSH